VGTSRLGAEVERSAGDLSGERVANLLVAQAGWCERLGSGLYAELLREASADVRAGGPVWKVLEPHADDPESSMLSLRFMGAVHRLVLEGGAPALARHYPSVGGRPGDGVWHAFRSAVEDQEEALEALMHAPVQTNEVGRSAALLGGFLTVARETGHPLRVLEIGASAGLNLLWDRYRYETPGGPWGDPASPVRFEGFLAEGRLPLDTHAVVVERRGCDAHPVDPTTEEGRLTLLSFVWPDQVARVERLRAAIEVARAVPATVDRSDAGSWLEMELRPEKDSATVVVHSIVWHYLGPEGQERAQSAIGAAGAAAETDSPVAWLRMEPGGEQAEIRLTRWPGGDERLLATTGFHGQGVRWFERGGASG
jgi:hypothetical protein